MRRPEAERIARGARVLDAAEEILAQAIREGRTLTARERAELLRLHDLALEVRGPELGPMKERHL